ncbi:MAG: hypothetical protein SXG53_14815 [Pseudomonadota bacterium]|nr:hypothetical protein [Pseudomonadota bacterium]
MLMTNIGAFDGKSWEALCQQVFKKKYAQDGYQQIKASPGDFGLEGFTLLTGFGFQCYCPDKHYPSKELYAAQRDKITTDLGKLKLYEADIAARINGTKLGHWVFVTPELERNVLLKHARTKEEEVRGWNLGILKTDFTIHLRDAEYYLTEINELRSASGLPLDFNVAPPVLQPLDQPQEIYEDNIRRKSGRRMIQKVTSVRYQELLEKLNHQTLTSFLGADGFFKRIEETAPLLYFRLLRLINEYELEVAEAAALWTGTPEELTVHIRDRLAKRVLNELSPEMTETTAAQIARHMVARWIAICELDYD